MKQRRNPPTIHPPAAGYSHQIEIRGPARMLVMSGQFGAAVDGSMSDDAASQFGQALDNVIANLRAAGMEAGDLDRLTFYFTEPVAPAVRNEVMRERLGDAQPCMTLLYVAGLAAPALKVEVDAWASCAEPAAATDS